MDNPPAHFPAWPGDAEVAVALTFDVDGEAPWLSEGPGYARRLTTLSQGRFGPARGLSRILALLAELEVTATFYVPGHTADQHPGAVEAILAAGHEVGHHGYLHRGTDGLDAAAQRSELEQGLTALGKLGVRPNGYRSPGWELTPETLDLLGELGFSYDASLMADDRPYWVTSGNTPLLELPGHWSLCDWPYFGYTPYDGGLLADPAAVERIWLAEFESARQDRRAVTYTMHPEAIGRGYLARMLDSVVTAMAGRGRPWFATHAQIADLASAPPIELPLDTVCMRITIRVKPGSARPSVGGEHDGALIVRVSAPAVDGKATEAALTALADSFGVRRSSVRLVSGASSRTKIVDIDAGDAAPSSRQMSRRKPVERDAGGPAVFQHDRRAEIP